MRDLDFELALIAKLPPFNAAWSSDLQDRWWAIFSALVDRAASLEPEDKEPSWTGVVGFYNWHPGSEGNMPKVSFHCDEFDALAEFCLAQQEYAGEKRRITIIFHEDKG